MAESKVPGMRDRFYPRYRCTACGYTLVASEEDAFCKKHGKMTLDTNSIHEQIQNALAAHQGR